MPTGAYIRTKNMYDSRRGRMPWNKGKKVIYSEEAKMRIILAHKGKPGPRKGVHLSTEIRQRLSMAHKGHVPWNKNLKGIHLSPSSEFKAGIVNVKAVQTRKRLYAEGKIVPWNKGKSAIYSENTIEKMRLAKFGLPLKEEHKLKIANSSKGGNATSFRTGHATWNKDKLGIHLSPSSEFRKGFAPWNKGKHGLYSEEHLKRMSLARSRIVIPYRDTTIEVILQNALSELNVKFRKHVPIKLSNGKYHQVDIFIEPNICIEADGDYWHSLEENRKRDDFINKDLFENGYVLYRFTEREIRAKQ